MDVKSLIKVFSNPGEFGYADTNVRRPIALDVRLKGQSLPKRRDYSPTETDTINLSRNIAPIYKRVEAIIMRMLHTDRGLPMKSNRSLFRTGSANAFTGADLVLWLMIDLAIHNKVEALHLAHMISHLGYIYPVDKAQLGQPVKDDGTLYRLQTTKYWPSQVVGDMEFRYGVFLVRKLLHKSKLRVQDYELDVVERMKEDVLKHYWHRVVTAAKEEYGVLRQQKKNTRATMEAQESAFWFSQKPPPPLNPATDFLLSRIATPLTYMEQVDTSDGALLNEVEFLQSNLLRHRVNMSTALKSLKNNCKQYMEYDPQLVAPFPSNPWITGSTMLWSYKASFVENANSTRVRQWGYSLDELLSDRAGRSVFEEFCEKQCCAENIRFWAACDNLHCTSLAQVPLEVHNIYREFLAEGCLSEINVSAEIKKQCSKDLVAPDRYAFTAAKNQVYYLMKEDIYPRFVRSEYYKMLLKPKIEDSGLLAFGRGLFSRLRRSRYGHPHRNSSVPDTSPFRIHGNFGRGNQPLPFGGMKQSNSLDSLQVLGTAGDADLFIQSLMKPCNNVTGMAINRKGMNSRKGSKLLQDGPRRRVSAPAPPILVHSTDGTTTVLEGTIEEPSPTTEPSSEPMVNGNNNSATNSPALPVSPLACSSFSKFNSTGVGKLRMISSSLDSLLVDSGTLKRRENQFGLQADHNASNPDIVSSVASSERKDEDNAFSPEGTKESSTMPVDNSRLSPNVSPHGHLQSSSSTSTLSTCSASSCPVGSTVNGRERSISVYHNPYLDTHNLSRPNSSNDISNINSKLTSCVDGFGSHQSL